MFSQSRAELIDHLREQMAFLRASSASYDAGLHIEGKRLAVTLRTLLHDTTTSSSLLGQLRIKDQLRFYDRYGPDDGSASTIFFGVTMSFSPNGFEYSAGLDEAKQLCSFEEFWNRVPIKERNIAFRHRDVILAVANQDGGAHIDPSLKEPYYQLSRDFAAAWTVTVGGKPGAVVRGPHLPVVRQCAFDVELTIARQAGALLGCSPI